MVSLEQSAEERILGGLDPEQRVVATTLNGPVCVRAGAGTGKTRAITHRIAWGIASGVYTPQKTLALTFTARAANEMRQRLRALGAPGVQARTFHSAALRQLQYFRPQAVGQPSITRFSGAWTAAFMKPSSAAPTPARQVMRPSPSRVSRRAT